LNSLPIYRMSCIINDEREQCSISTKLINVQENENSEEPL